eukprot:987090-Karenia_brevis.AAC.1
MTEFQHQKNSFIRLVKKTGGHANLVSLSVSQSVRRSKLTDVRLRDCETVRLCNCETVKL